MARKNENQTSQLGTLQRVASAVRKMFGRGSEESEIKESMTASPAAETASRPAPRTTQRGSDIPMDVLDRTYTPPFTGSKAGFRSDGADHQNDQEFAYGVADERWNDEDRLTNKSGDPRIGTHRRTYEPGESRIGSNE